MLEQGQQPDVAALLHAAQHGALLARRAVQRHRVVEDVGRGAAPEQQVHHLLRAVAVRAHEPPARLVHVAPHPATTHEVYQSRVSLKSNVILSEKRCFLV